jgi:hypothetical protein
MGYGVVKEDYHVSGMGYGVVKDVFPVFDLLVYFIFVFLLSFYFF